MFKNFTLKRFAFSWSFIFLSITLWERLTGDGIHTVPYWIFGLMMAIISHYIYDQVFPEEA